MRHYRKKNSKTFSQKGPAKMFPLARCGSRQTWLQPTLSLWTSETLETW